MLNSISTITILEKKRWRKLGRIFIQPSRAVKILYTITIRILIKLYKLYCLDLEKLGITNKIHLVCLCVRSGREEEGENVAIHKQILIRKIVE